MLNSKDRLYVGCSCYSLEHIAVFDKSFLESEGEVILSVRLKDVPFIKRLGRVWKYLFGIDRDDYDFIELSLNKNACKDIVDFLTLDNKNNYKNSENNTENH